ncbi:MAG: THUMP domain-containing protein [Candidatus Woesearchaeota archaeon]
MVMNCILVRYSELALKGSNRSVFERKLAKNIGSCLNLCSHAYEKIERVRNRIIIHTDKECLELKHVFGISSYSPAIICPLSIEGIKDAVSLLTKNLDKASTFRVTAQRLSKDFPMDSIELDKEIGSFVVHNSHAKVSLHSFDLEIGIEILRDHSFVFTKRVECAGGLPLGTGGRVVSLINSNHSIVASWLIMRRGLVVVPVALTDIDISALKKYSPGLQPDLTLINDISDLPELIIKSHAKALVLGDASSFKKPFPDILTLFPLVGFSENEIDDLFSKIQ